MNDHRNNSTAYEQSYIENDEEIEDAENNSAKLFERSRIKALAGPLIQLIVRF